MSECVHGHILPFSCGCVVYASGSVNVLQDDIVLEVLSEPKPRPRAVCSSFYVYS